MAQPLYSRRDLRPPSSRPPRAFVSAPSRFQSIERLASHGAVETARGVDTLTGLPVRVYTFPDAPLDAARLESEYVPGILASGLHDGGGYVIVAHAADYRPLARDRATPELLVDAAQGLRDAAAAGVPHGDLRPERLLEADGHVLIEGYGVPWQAAGDDRTAPGATTEDRLAADVSAFASAALDFDRGDWPPAMRTALEEARDAEPTERPSAGDLLARLRAALADAPPAQRRGTAVALRSLDGITLEAFEEVPGGSGAADLMDEFDFDLRAPEPDEAASPAGEDGTTEGADDPDPLLADDGAPDAKAPASAARGRSPRRAIDDPEPIAINSDPDPDTIRVPDEGSDRASATSPVFVKDVPPGATYRAGDAEESAPPAAFRFESDRGASPPRTRRRFVAIAAILAVAVVLAIVMLPRGFGPPSDEGPPVLYTVDIAVEPPTIPRVDLLVVASPAGSAFGPGDVLDSVPGQVLLDAEGTWLLRGRFQGRLTETVRLVVPAERRASLVVENAASGTTP